VGKTSLICLLTAGLLPLLADPSLLYADSDFFTQQRNAMVSRQIEARGITDERVLAAMKKVPRHAFVPQRLRFFAYADRPLPIGEGQTISQPYIVALMTSVLALKGDEKVLEIGTGSGYQAAILAELVPKVYTIEIVPALAHTAAERLKRLGYDTIEVKTGDGYQGWPDQAPFDAIIVTAAPDEIPQRLVEQLADGGRMILPLAEGYPQKLIRLEKRGERILQEHISDVMFVPMIHGTEE
jgi:protein-L-isoaspartate(D-aspartate) O-methyltransferase